MPRADEPDYLRIRGLWKSFGDFQALRNVSLDIARGEFVCFLGPSGCGKTTLLRAIAGLDLQSAGSIRQGGEDVSDRPPASRDFGIVFQSYALFPNLTIRRNIAFGLENTGVARRAIDERVDELLALVGLPEQADKYPAQLSGGQQQRVALARALAMSPGLLLLDEPLSALDARVRVRLRHEVRELQRKLGVTTIMVTHDQEEALAMADRIVVMNHGVVEQVGTPTEVYREPATLFVADFIGEMNQLPAVSDGPGKRVRVGARAFRCSPHERPAGAAAIAALRPEDIVPDADGDTGDADGNGDGTNTLDVTVDEMEFLGSFWRARLGGAELAGTPLFADFSVNAVRRLDIGVGGGLRVRLPHDRLKVFPHPGDAVSDAA